jgi:hypothetical protein
MPGRTGDAAGSRAVSSRGARGVAATGWKTWLAGTRSFARHGARVPADREVGRFEEMASAGALRSRKGIPEPRVRGLASRDPHDRRGATRGLTFDEMAPSREPRSPPLLEAAELLLGRGGRARRKGPSCRAGSRGARVPADREVGRFEEMGVPGASRSRRWRPGSLARHRLLEAAELLLGRGGRARREGSLVPGGSGGYFDESPPARASCSSTRAPRRIPRSA